MEWSGMVVHPEESRGKSGLDVVDVDQPAETLLLAQQQTLGSALLRLRRALQGTPGVDPTLTMDTVLTVLASIRTWFETGTVVVAVQDAGAEDLERWEDGLVRTGVLLDALRELVQVELVRVELALLKEL